MKRDLRFYLKLMFYTFKISAFTFGGGYVIVTLMKKQFVDELGWIDEKEMLDFTAMSQSSPGPIAVNASVLVGNKVGGVVGSIVALVGTVLPPLIILTVISHFYTAFIKINAVRYLLLGMQSGVSAVICDAVYTMFKTVWKESRWIALITSVIAFVLVAVLSVNVIIIIIACIILGIILYGRGEKKA